MHLSAIRSMLNLNHGSPSARAMDNIRSDRWRPHQCFRALETPPGDVEALKWKKKLLCAQTGIFEGSASSSSITVNLVEPPLWTTHDTRNDRLRPHQGFRTLETPPGHVEALKYQNTWVCAHALSNHPQTTSRAQNIH